MKIVTGSEELGRILGEESENGKSMGFVPTMGALHQGHFSLIARSKKQCDLTVCSIFVNPTQFNEASDLKNYPRNHDSDATALAKLGCDILFLPSTQEIYPTGTDHVPELDFEGLDKAMEGHHRPGHFEGVVQVVKRLLEIVRCDFLFMGQKDFQQFTIIQHMIDFFAIPVQLVVCPIVREKNGLAMSSRNERLSKEYRDDAGMIYRVLLQAKKWVGKKSPREIEEKAKEYLSVKNFKPEYFTIVNAQNLQPIESFEHASEVVACTAVWAGDVRLIDNIYLKS